ncbi:signal peptidase I [Candidatus Adlerbacteria bacterium RIFCSPLOWO2_01_FULL_54_21b]|uniref:Signal peptidase I n=1 Tax=Candidatus Adlerbacteria bacterium RIFCSPLOWO2_01_FULL_54_21b TaxID=1797245 RepID=A0A1F4XZU4_9BACT|nr:MAG: signal peptidase I [Candidatus Adlerbacteria bacterium RIFCSPLOWO2_01_FULL_54_21b]
MPEAHRENFFIELLKFVLVAAAIVVPVRLFVAQPFIVSGASMDPTFNNGQYLIIDELSYRLHEPERGDVVIFRYPRGPKEFFIKRIVGLPGETVAIRNGVVYVAKNQGSGSAGIIGNDAFTKLDEPYVVNRGNGADATHPVGQNEYFVMGDNRPESSDSRIWGMLPRANIIGYAYLRLLPLHKLGIFPGALGHYSPTDTAALPQ